jgi:hypothetical protein
MIQETVKALTEKNNGLGPTTSEIYEDVAGRSNRHPKKELLPGMLRAIGCVEKDGRWVFTQQASQQNNEEDAINRE